MVDKRYRECMAEIIGVLKKYDMAGAVTVVDKERAMFKYHFPTWTCIELTQTSIGIRARKEDYPTFEARHRVRELSAHVIMQMRDISMNTLAMTSALGDQLVEKLGMEHKPGVDFDPELDQ
jgi:hypothetical protein